VQNRFNAVTYNLLTRRWTENIALEKAIGSLVDNIYPYNWIVSPDGKRILYRTLGFPPASQPGAGAKQTHKLYVCALMVGSVIKSHTGEIKSMGWCPANNGYFIITPDDQGRGALSLYNQDGKQTQTTSIAISGYVGQAYMDTKGSLFDLMGLSLYVAHAPDYVIHDLPLNMDGNRDTNDSREVVISPNRGGFADIEHVSMRPFWSHILENVNVYYPHTRACVAISVCNTDGSGWHEVGRCPYAFAPYSLQWTPDGKRLSFIYDNALWTVPAQ